MSYELFIGGVAAGVVSCIAAVTASLIARRAEREYRELRSGVPLLNSIEDLKYEQERLQSRNVELAASVQRYEEMEQRLPGLERVIADLEARRSELAPMEEEHRRLQREVGDARMDVERIGAERAGAEKQLATVREESAKERQRAEEMKSAAALARGEADLARQQRDALHAEAAQLRSQIADSEASVRILQAEVAKLVAEDANARATIAAHQKQLELIQSSIGDAKARSAALEERLVELERRGEELRSTVAKTTAELRKLDGEIAAALAKKEAMLAELERLREAIAKLEEEKARKASEVDDTVRHLQGMQSKSVGGAFTLIDAVKDLFEPQFESSSSEGTQPLGDEEKALNTVKAHAERLGFHYSDRVIRSFHTSLKLGRHAPLLVLAGISGTGKSQLPRLYADALGIHFLPMAVQPGWDSPADLLGFFSHIEQRFKPTVLARALAQMDRFLPEHMEGLVEREYKVFADAYRPQHDRMLLVLLDEMNLARVEYYFSDFLSRLELRNASGFNPANSEHRQRVALRIEAPGATGRLNHVSIFPGDNVLFVGTMNEDESTMSLSDKVLDRANVLRFDRPEKLESGREEQGQAERTIRLTADHWQTWVQLTRYTRAQKQRVDKIAGWTQRLNTALDHVQRPFGHRTAASIQAYCLGYPPHGDQATALHDAFADQIEQRVMPKLRGIDPTSDGGSTALSEIREIIRELKDDALIDALDRGRDANDGHNFVWYGVRRKPDA